jgi:hypothetical protein
MARRKKKQTRKQQAKQQRQAEIARIRKERGWRPSHTHSKRPQDEVIEDMLPLFPLIDDPSTSPAAGMEQLMMTLVASEDLIEEPEFEDIIIDPMRCVDTLVEVGEELGIDPAALSQLPDEEREDTTMQMLEMTTRRLLTDELRQDILSALNSLRLRLKQAGQPEKAAKAASLQSFLGGSETSEVWPLIGLVQAIVQRSLAAGFELLEASMEVVGADGLDETETPLSLAERVAQSSVAQKANTLLQKVPGLSRFLEKQADSIWDEGIDAVFAGDLYLGIFAVEELEVGFDIFKTTLGDNLSQETDAQEPITIKPTEEQSKALVLGIDDFITELFTPLRLDLLRTRLDTILNDKDSPRRWIPFILMLADYLADEEAVANEKGFLISAFLGEMRAVGAALQQGNDE